MSLLWLLAVPAIIFACAWAVMRMANVAVDQSDSQWAYPAYMALAMTAMMIGLCGIALAIAAAFGPIVAGRP